MSTPPRPSLDPELTTHAFGQLLLERWKTLLGFAAVSFLAMLFYLALIAPPQFQARAVVLVPNWGESAYGSESYLQTAFPFTLRPETEAQAMQGADVLLAVIERLQLGRYPDYSRRLGSGGLMSRHFTDQEISDTQQALTVLNEQLNLTAEDSSQTITITLLGQDPVLTAQIVNVLVEEYKLRRSDGLNSNLSATLQRLETNVATSRDDLITAQTTYDQSPTIENQLRLDALSDLHAQQIEQRNQASVLLSYPLPELQMLVPASTPLQAQFPKISLLLVLATLFGLVFGTLFVLQRYK